MRPAYPGSRQKAAAKRGFTLLETMIAMALVALVLISLNTFVFSMGELWGRGTDVRLFEQHARAVTRFLERELRAAVLPPAGKAVTPEEFLPPSGSSDNLLAFELPEGSRFISWPDRPLPDVVCMLQAREREGLVLLWHSRWETRFSDSPPRESVISPLVTALAYDYYDPGFKRWTTEKMLKKDATSKLEVPQRLRLTFTYGKLTHETVITLPIVTEASPNF